MYLLENNLFNIYFLWESSAFFIVPWLAGRGGGLKSFRAGTQLDIQQGGVDKVQKVCEVCWKLNYNKLLKLKTKKSIYLEAFFQFGASWGKTTFLNDIFKVWFSKIQPRHAINIYLNLYILVFIWNKDNSS